MSAKKKNLDLYLAEIYKEYIAIKDEDYKKSQDIFKAVFEQVKLKMGEKCNYFKKYSSQTIIAGSVDDGIKVSKLDEFDMDIVIRLPINSADETEKGIIMEYDEPGFVKIKIIDCFDNLDKQPEWEKCHVVTKEWRDSKKYLLQNKFRSWLHGIVEKALNDMNRKIMVKDTSYIITYKESGPAYTLNIKSCSGEEKFCLDVDLVPVIRFTHPRWPTGYRIVKPPAESNQVKEWYVVPKPNKSIQDETQKNRCWRLSFQVFEKDMMRNRQQLKTTIRLIKKLRDNLGMKEIASYYIKTLFLWKISEKDEKYWQTKPSLLLHVMLKELYAAIEKKNIPYYWHKDNNLIGGLKPSLQKIYLDKLNALIKSIEANDVDAIVEAFLTQTELKVYKASEFYQNQAAKEIVDAAKLSTNIVSKQASVDTDVAKISTTNLCTQTPVPCIDKTKLINSLISKVDKLTSIITDLQDRVKRLEIAVTHVNENSKIGESLLMPLSSQEFLDTPKSEFRI